MSGMDSIDTRRSLTPQLARALRRAEHPFAGALAVHFFFAVEKFGKQISKSPIWRISHEQNGH